MKLHPIFHEPEVYSGIFLIANIFGAILIRLICSAWPLSLFWSSFYIILIFLINHALAAGRYYLPTKDLRGQTVIITGAATGIGRVCALQLTKLGARVIIGIRGQERAERIAKELSIESQGGTVIGYDLDLSNLAYVKDFAQKIDQVDILINNAGAVQETYSETINGIEKQFGTNHIGHFYLTQLLLPMLNNGRIINVSSLAHHVVKSTDLDYTFKRWKNQYDSFRVYGLSKLAQIYHASELHRRYGIKAYSLHPGVLMNMNFNQEKSFLERVILQLLSIVGKTVEQGAMTSLFCALSNEAKPGHFHSNCQVTRPSSLASDSRHAEQCWIESERMIDGQIK